MAIGNFNEMIGGPENGLHLVHEMFRLFEEEGIYDASVPRAYYDAFQIAIGHGDKARAKIFAERAYVARLIVEGEDSPAVIKAKRLAERPEEHWSYRRIMGPSTASKSPQPADTKELEDLLWMEGNCSKHNSTSNVNDDSHTQSLDAWLQMQQFLAKG